MNLPKGIYSEDDAVELDIISSDLGLFTITGTYAEIVEACPQASRARVETEGRYPRRAPRIPRGILNGLGLQYAH